jgi:hypothetical protein
MTDLLCSILLIYGSSGGYICLGRFEEGRKEGRKEGKSGVMINGRKG